MFNKIKTKLTQLSPLKRVWLGFCLIIAGALIVTMFQKPEQTTEQSDTSEYMSIIESDSFKELTFDEFKESYQSQTKTMYYFGYETCPWCVDALPVLQQVAQDYNITISYVNTKELKKSEDNFKTFKELVSSIVSEDDKVYVPQVIVAAGGEIISNHEGTYEGHDANETELTDEQKQDLYDVYGAMAMLLDDDVHIINVGEEVTIGD